MFNFETFPLALFNVVFFPFHNFIKETNVNRQNVIAQKHCKCKIKQENKFPNNHDNTDIYQKFNN